jgi:hypothetical protein
MSKHNHVTLQSSSQLVEYTGWQALYAETGEVRKPVKRHLNGGKQK